MSRCAEESPRLKGFTERFILLEEYNINTQQRGNTLGLETCRQPYLYYNTWNVYSIDRKTTLHGIGVLAHRDGQSMWRERY